MELLNRAALVVTPKRRFLEWANGLPDVGKPLTIAEAQSLRVVYLVVTGDVTPPLTDLIDIYWREIFEDALDEWTIDDSLWPTNRTAHVFRDWFHVDCIEGVVDADPGEPITVHELARTRCAVCESDLDADAIAVVSFADHSVQRMTVQELDAVDERETEAAEDSTRPLMVFRCCREPCAKRIEETLTASHREE